MRGKNPLPRGRDPIPGGKKGGSIDLSKDYSKFSKGRGSRAVFASLTLLPYIGISVFVYFEGLKVLAILLLALPLLFFIVFFALMKVFDK
ncbi:MAG: hypothetical protein AAFQ63_14105 [Cyanobacteria bacterium J06621_11]